MTTRQEAAQCQHRQSTKTTGYALRDQWTCAECGTETGGSCGPILQDHEGLLATVRALEAQGERKDQALREIEWSVAGWHQGDYAALCPVCRNPRQVGHTSECSIGAALAPKPAAGDVGEGV